MRTDNGGEYTSNEFMEYCSPEGIKKEHVVPYTPQQNGVAEQKNMTMVGAAKAMLFDQGLPLFLWAEEYRIAIYIQNMCPHTALGRKTPEEVFTSTRPDVSHIRIFGNVCYCHVHADNRKKSDHSGEKGLLVGYNDISKEYRVYIPARRRVIVRRDVQFDEDRALRRSMDLPAEEQPTLDSGVKLEEPEVQAQVQTQGTSSGT